MDGENKKRKQNIIFNQLQGPIHPALTLAKTGAQNSVQKKVGYSEERSRVNYKRKVLKEDGWWERKEKQITTSDQLQCPHPPRTASDEDGRAKFCA